jgi:hypothetical protein
MERTIDPTLLQQPEASLELDSAFADAMRKEEEEILSKVSTYHLPPEVDDRDDPSVAERQKPPALQQQVTTRAIAPVRLRTDTPQENVLRIVEQVAGSAGLGQLFDAIAPASEEAAAQPEVAEGEATTVSEAASLEPRLRLRVQALVCRNYDGRLSNGDVGQSRPELETAISAVITGANTMLANANIELVFFPSADIEMRNDTYLNQDFVLSFTARQKLAQYPPMSEADAYALANTYSTAAYRNDVSRKYEGRIVLLFAEGTALTNEHDKFGEATDIPVAADFDGDGRADIAVWRPKDGTWHARTSAYGGYLWRQWGQNGDRPVPADFDGDKRADLTVWRPSNGTWYIIESSTGKIRTQQWGQNGDIPVPADYDGDKKADLAVWRPANGTWLITESSTGKVRSVQWGQTGDIPVPADYDGDGKTDLAVWRPSDGKWYIIASSTGAMTQQQWGQNGDVPVPADFDADGKANLTVWRPANGTWYRLSATNVVTTQQWGQAGDVPMPRRFDSDSKADLCVWRPSNAQWYIIDSATGNFRHDDWRPISPSGGGFSWSDLEFVKLGGWVNPHDPSFIAHEVGHYLHLAHTMVNYSASAQEKATLSNVQLRDLLIKRITDALNAEKAKGTPTSQLTQRIMDPDRPDITDTAPDPGPELIHYINAVANGGNACSTIASHTFTISTGEKVLVAPDRTLVMSYFKGCPGISNRVSAQQGQRIRNALINGNRRHIVRVQLGETAYPGEVVAGVWNPNTTGQFYTWDKSYDDFRILDEQQNKVGLYLASQQAYTKNGATRYDGIWNPASQKPDIIWGWLVEHFSQRNQDNTAKGLRLRHLESYLLPDGQVRMNAIWYPGSRATSWVQGWAAEHLNGKLTEMYNGGWRVIHLNAWNLPNNGPVRYDVVWEAGHSYQQFVRLEMSGAEVTAEYGTHWAAARKLHVLDTFRNGSVQRWAGVWNPNPNAQYVMFGHTREQIRASYDEMWHQNMKLGSMAMVKF